MLRILALGFLLMVYPPLLKAQESRTIHRQAYDCRQQFGDNCDRVCRTCHDGAPRPARSAAQLWNPSLLWIDEYEGFSLPFTEEAENFWTTLPYEHFACLECHAEQAGTGQHPLGRLTIEEDWPWDDSEEAARIRYFDGLLLCATCHDPHSGEKNLLRMANDGSKLCLHCHRK